eukprot:jgi/Botrbrau1/15857/Bobra.40_1s0041.1
MQTAKLEGASSLEDDFESSDEKSSGDIELGMKTGTANLRRVDSVGKTVTKKRTNLRPIKSMTEIAGAEDVEDIPHGITPGLTITMKDVVYTVRSHRNRKEKVDLLKNVSGWFSPGEMAALMGPSGSGKTTLLDLLAGRKTTGQRTGDIRFGGVRPSPQFLRRYTGYVEQFDTLIGTLTVSEMLLYTAELKRPMTEKIAKKKEAVGALLEDLGLTPCKDTLIGDAMHRGISGGQAKRTNIGIALITNPKVLFLDEPTSGLDSYTSNEVMTVVKRFTQLGITICATIHSPTPYAFRLFDTLMLLLRGHVVYFGERGEAAIDYFRSLQSQIDVRDDLDNEAEWIVDITTQADRQSRASDFAKFLKRAT